MQFVKAATLLSLCTASTDSEATGFIHVPVGRQNLASTNKFKRETGESTDIRLVNNETHYYIDFEIGTPPQSIPLAFNTSASDFVVIGVGEDIRSQAITFNSSQSSTYKSNGTSFSDFNQYRGEMGQDVVRFGSIELQNANIGVVNESRALTLSGTAGFGVPGGELAFQRGNIDRPYLNLPQQLKAQGTIQQAAYSLWLNKNGTDAGSLLLGGIDHTKYKGPLYVIPLISNDYDDGDDDDGDDDDEPEISQFSVILNGLSAYDEDGNEQPFAATAIPAVLDSGSSVSYFPERLLGPFYEALGTSYDLDYAVGCKYWKTVPGGVGIQLGGVDVTVSFANLLVSTGPPGLGEAETCLTFWPSSSDHAIIGDNILRSLYVVYDIDNLEVGIAAAETGSSANATSSVEVLSTGIPGQRVDHDTRKASGVFQTTQLTILGTNGASLSSHISSASPTSSAESTFSNEARVSLPTSVQATYVIGEKPGANNVTATASTNSSVPIQTSAGSNSTVSHGSAPTNSSASGGGAGVVGGGSGPQSTGSGAESSIIASGTVSSAFSGSVSGAATSPAGSATSGGSSAGSASSAQSAAGAQGNNGGASASDSGASSSGASSSGVPSASSTSDAAATKTVPVLAGIGSICGALLFLL